MKTIIQVKQISSDEAKAQAFAIRMRVFVREQGVPAADRARSRRSTARFIFWQLPREKPWGPRESSSHHGSAKIGRMAVLKSYRA